MRRRALIPLLVVLATIPGCPLLLADDYQLSAASFADASQDAADDVVPDDTGRYESTPLPPDTGDGSSDAAEAACDPRAPFGPPALLTELDTAANESSLRLSADYRVAYFSSDRDGDAGGWDLFTATRTDPIGSFAPATPLSTVNTIYEEYDPSVSGDGTTLYFSSDRPGGLGGLDVYVATRANAGSPFVNPANVGALNTPSFDGQPFVREDGQAIYLQSDRGTGSYGVYRAVQSGSAFQPPVFLSELDSDSALPAVMPDDLTIYFASGRSGAGTQGGTDVWRATRASAGDTFGAPSVVAEVNSAADDYPSFVTRDGCTLYLWSTRPGAGGEDLYVAKR
jgi:hypothetical protein